VCSTDHLLRILAVKLRSLQSAFACHGGQWRLTCLTLDGDLGSPSYGVRSLYSCEMQTKQTKGRSASSLGKNAECILTRT
jgi:hypothetical protein